MSVKTYWLWARVNSICHLCVVKSNTYLCRGSFTWHFHFLFVIGFWLKCLNCTWSLPPGSCTHIEFVLIAFYVNAIWLNCTFTWCDLARVHLSLNAIWLKCTWILQTWFGRSRFLLTNWVANVFWLHWWLWIYLWGCLLWHGLMAEIWWASRYFHFCSPSVFGTIVLHTWIMAPIKATNQFKWQLQFQTRNGREWELCMHMLPHMYANVNAR